MFVRCFSDKVYEAQQWPAVLQLETTIFSTLSVYLEELQALPKDDLLKQIRDRVTEIGFPPVELASVATETFIADFLRENIDTIASFLSGLPQGQHIPIEICVACQRADVLMRCLEESPEFAHTIEMPWFTGWLEKAEQEIEARLRDL